MTSIVSVVFSPRFSQKGSTDTLLGQLGPGVRAVYGHGECLRGCFGSSKRFTYGTILPNFSRTLEILLRLEFRSSKQV
jgi:hypothetical protein